MEKLPITKQGEAELSKKLRELKTKIGQKFLKPLPRLGLMVTSKKMLNIMLQRSSKDLLKQKFKK